MKILIPIDKTSQFDKWRDKSAKIRPSIKLFKKGFQLCWELDKKPHEQGSKIIGIDQGYNTVATLSDGQSTPNICPHGHSLKSIIDKLSRKKKGSKSFQKAQAHRNNFICWSINQLDFSGLKEVRLEKVVNIRRGVRTSRSISHWSNPLIRDKIKRRCEELEVPVVEQSCAYRSQRCSQCGLVRKANRRGKIYSCNGCHLEIDADFNAAKNHEIDLPPIPFGSLGKRLNLGKGFLWKAEGVFDLDGAELIVSRNQKKIFK